MLGLILFGVLLWLLIGWLPTRIVKYWFVTGFTNLTEEEAWGRRMEALSVFVMFLGPGAWLCVLLTNKGDWGWKW